MNSCLILFIIFLNIVKSTTGWWWGNDTKVTVQPSSSSPLSSSSSSSSSPLRGVTITTTITTNPTTKHEDLDLLKVEAGTIAGVVFGVILGAVFIAVIGILYIRRKRARDRAYSRSATVHRMSKQSAGVYGDTTVDSNLALNTEDRRFLPRNTNIYHDDSEDELWSANER